MEERDQLSSLEEGDVVEVLDDVLNTLRIKKNVYKTQKRHNRSKSCVLQANSALEMGSPENARPVVRSVVLKRQSKSIGMNQLDALLATLDSAESLTDRQETKVAASSPPPNKREESLLRLRNSKRGPGQEDMYASRKSASTNSTPEVTRPNSGKQSLMEIRLRLMNQEMLPKEKVNGDSTASTAPTRQAKRLSISGSSATTERRGSTLFPPRVMIRRSSEDNEIYAARHGSVERTTLHSNDTANELKAEARIRTNYKELARLLSEVSAKYLPSNELKEPGRLANMDLHQLGCLIRSAIIEAKDIALCSNKEDSSTTSILTQAKSLGQGTIHYTSCLRSLKSRSPEEPCFNEDILLVHSVQGELLDKCSMLIEALLENTSPFWKGHRAFEADGPEGVGRQFSTAVKTLIACLKTGMDLSLANAALYSAVASANSVCNELFPAYTRFRARMALLTLVNAGLDFMSMSQDRPHTNRGQPDQEAHAFDTYRRTAAKNLVDATKGLVLLLREHLPVESPMPSPPVSPSSTTRALAKRLEYVASVSHPQVQSVFEEMRQPFDGDLDPDALHESPKTLATFMNLLKESDAKTLDSDKLVRCLKSLVRATRAVVSSIPSPRSSGITLEERLMNNLEAVVRAASNVVAKQEEILTQDVGFGEPKAKEYQTLVQECNAAMAYFVTALKEETKDVGSASPSSPASGSSQTAQRRRASSASSVRRKTSNHFINKALEQLDDPFAVGATIPPLPEALRGLAAAGRKMLASFDSEVTSCSSSSFASPSEQSYSFSSFLHGFSTSLSLLIQNIKTILNHLRTLEAECLIIRSQVKTLASIAIVITSSFSSSSSPALLPSSSSSVQFASPSPSVSSINPTTWTPQQQLKAKQMLTTPVLELFARVKKAVRRQQKLLSEENSERHEAKSRSAQRLAKTLPQLSLPHLATLPEEDASHSEASSPTSYCEIEDQKRVCVSSPGRAPVVCGLCETVITGTYVEALGKCWHKHHLCCAKCGQVLGFKYYEVEGRAYCEEDYADIIVVEEEEEEEAVAVCGYCREHIRGAHVEAVGQRWHMHHFRCASCSCNLVNLDFYEHAGKAYCEEHIDSALVDDSDDSFT